MIFFYLIYGTGALVILAHGIALAYTTIVLTCRVGVEPWSTLLPKAYLVVLHSLLLAAILLVGLDASLGILYGGIEFATFDGDAVVLTQHRQEIRISLEFYQVRYVLHCYGMLGAITFWIVCPMLHHQMKRMQSDATNAKGS